MSISTDFNTRRIDLNNARSVAAEARRYEGTPQTFADLILSILNRKPEPATRQAKEHSIVELAVLRHRMASDFGASRGWSYSHRGFLPSTLAGRKRTGGGAPWYAFDSGADTWSRTSMDHPLYYRAERRVVAALGQPYLADGRRDEVQAWAAKRGLAVHFPDFPSWWFPGQTTLVLFTRAPTVV